MQLKPLCSDPGAVRAVDAGGREHRAERDHDVQRGQAAAHPVQRVGRQAGRQVQLPRRLGR